MLTSGSTSGLATTAGDREGAVGSNDGDSGSAALHVEGLRKAFDGTPALDGLDMTAAHGEVVALVGPNGAGKTTAMRCAAGVLAPDGGAILVDGAPAGSVAAADVLSFLPEQPDLYASLTVAEHLRFVALAHRLSGWEARASELLDRFDLHAQRDALPGALSQGMRRKTALIMALLHGARVLLLDEPFNGLDPRGAAELRTLIGDLAAGGAAVVVSTHGLAVAERLADRAVVMAQGRALADGTPDELRRLARLPEGADLEAVFLALTAEAGNGGDMARDR
jgi:ABC-2 type transport system ATP-binding protein